MSEKEIISVNMLDMQEGSIEVFEDNCCKPRLENVAHQDADADRIVQLTAEVNRLQTELNGLRENVVIESMNQMKIDYADICTNAVCVCQVRKLRKEKDDLARDIIGIKCTSYSIYERFDDILDIVKKEKQEIQSKTWVELRKELKHFDHILLHLTDLCDQAEVVPDGRSPSTSKCICKLQLSGILDELETLF